MSTRRESGGREQRVLLVFNTQLHHHASVVSGIRDCLSAWPAWKVRFVRPNDMTHYQRAIRDWEPHGIIVASDHARGAVLSDLGCPLVAVGCRHDVACTAQVYYDDREAGRLAAAELLQYPIASAALVAHPGHPGAESRNAGFAEAMRAAGVPVMRTNLLENAFEAADRWCVDERGLFGWLRNLPRPCGIFGWNDDVCGLLLWAAKDAGLHVPNEALLIGADNRRDMVEAAEPHVSSVITPFEAAGREAVAVLSRVMSGRDYLATTLVPVAGVVTRESTQWRGLEDPLVLSALDLIHRGGGSRHGVTGLCGELGCSRRSLERRFRAAVGQTVLAAIQAQRVKRAIGLLRTGSLSVAGVANECGFRSPRSLETLLKKQTGKLPRDFRGYR